MAMKFGPAISQEAISEVAKRHGVPEEEVRKEMEFISRLAEGILGILQTEE